jgi:hypothetical protein
MHCIAVLPFLVFYMDNRRSRIFVFFGFSVYINWNWIGKKTLTFQCGHEFLVPKKRKVTKYGYTFFFKWVDMGIHKSVILCWFQIYKVALGTKCTKKSSSKNSFQKKKSQVSKNIGVLVHFATKINLHFWNRCKITDIFISILPH